ncbi:uncharacterized protein FIBRA_02000 [Fibroporia radiculosa]|uniref:Ras-domain-containing protein n=1 Tax=Fibroporia radiculosa TaxID=599839 RepID=J4GM31_9APHY|nr:uncharacterized protein FIBRA_02000 [Fibroporia radiculosa]CCL99975.1 predicted protein [Fibroporia radiculosa]
MRTVKVVVIGASGVGKTSLRNQYISGRFTTGYRATIGADFITKSVPHYNSPEENITLQIWDTAGQERFSSLSSAFFRGADAAILIFDVNQPDSLRALVRWWSEFRDKAPIPDEEVEDFCCVVVGNKIDMLDSAHPNKPRVSEADAMQLLDELVPPSSLSLTLPPIMDVDQEDGQAVEDTPLSPTTPSKSIDILTRHHRRSVSKSRSRSRSTIFRGGTLGTMTTTHTVYHTPSSSIFDAFESALSSPARPLSTASVASSSPRSLSPGPARVPRRQPSASSVSSVPTITPSLFLRDRATSASTTPASAPSPSHSLSALPPPPERRPKLFFSSAKTGEGVADIFEYVARRVVMQCEYEEALEARTLHIQDADDTIRLSRTPTDNRRLMTSCCGS